jgi:3-hydroxyisobutyrate dehydrogenase-like beta-hydroxyacid dehydrogenase
MTPRIALIGFGEVGQILASDLTDQGVENIVVHDRLFADPGSAPSRAAAQAPVQVVSDIAQACAGRDLVISAVTAGQALAVATAAAPNLRGAIFLDLNSVEPRTRLASQQVIAEHQGLYVEGAVMAPIAPKRLKTPVLLGGPHARGLAPLVEQLGFAARVFSEDVGRASAVKLSRSIFVKGLEAIVTESLASARHFGVEAEVLASLSNTLPHEDWPGLAHYLITRPLTHGRRRSEEMAEAAAMLDAAGLPAPMTRATVELHARQGALGLGADEDQPDSLPDLLDAVAERTTGLSNGRGS